MRATRKPKPRKRKWGVHTISVEHPRNGFYGWGYVQQDGSLNHCAHVEVYGQMGEFVYVATDDYEGTAMFPSALIDDVIRELRAIKKAKAAAPPKESSR